MLMAGKSVTQAGDQLHALNLERMFLGLTKPKGDLVNLLQQLRSLKTIDPNAYRKAKTKLPYVVSGYFNPAIRRKENFAWTEHFIIDIDHLSMSGLDPAAIKNLLHADDRIALLFTSPGNDGVKVIFNLKQRIHDAGYYSAFYKIFAAKFALEYRIENLVDLVTNDVSRCCFMSYDPEAKYNPAATFIDPSFYLDPNSLHVSTRSNTEVNEVESISIENKKISGEGTGDSRDLPNDVLLIIKQKLGQVSGRRVPKTKEYIQPKAITDAMPGLENGLKGMGINLIETRMIHYGRQLKVSAGVYWAEVNLFHGKHGFKAVQTTKTGSNKELAELAVKAIQLYFDNHTVKPLINTPDLPV